MPENINPHNLEAEEQVLGAMIVDNDLIHRTSITSEDFYAQKHRELFISMLELMADGMPIDYASLREKNQDIALISKLVGSIVTTANFNFHADIVKENANRRRIRTACLQAINEIQSESVDAVMSKIRTQLSEIARGRGNAIISSQDIAKDLHDFLERRVKNRSALSGVPSGFPALDKITDGWQNGDLVIIAARPGQGKSALAMALSENAQVPVGIISIEMGAHQIGIRTLATLSGIELWRLRKGILQHEHWHDVTQGISRFAELPLYFSFSAKNSIEIERTITQMVQTYDCKMIVVDYLQLTKGSNGKKREQEVAEVSRLLKIMAQTHNIPVIALSQLNREVEKRENRRPILSDLRESGAIEQDADVVIFLYQDKDEETLHVDIAKGRNIGLGEIKLHFEGDTMRFAEVTA